MLYFGQWVQICNWAGSHGLYKLLDLTTAGHSFFYMKTSQKNHFPLELEDFFLLLWSFLLYNRLNMRFFRLEPTFLLQCTMTNEYDQYTNIIVAGYITSDSRLYRIVYYTFNVLCMM